MELSTPINICDALSYSDFENKLDGTDLDKKNAFIKIQTFYESLTVYGSIEFPIFLESEVRKKLGLSKSIRRKNISDKASLMIMAKGPGGKIRTYKALTERGLYQVLGSSNSVLADEWYDLVYDVFHQLRLNGEVKLKQLIANHDVEMKKLHDSIDNIKENYNQQQIETEVKYNRLRKETSDIECVKNQIGGQLKLLENEIELNKPMHDDEMDKKLTLNEVQKAYMIPIYVYIVNLTDYKDKYNNYNLNDYDEININDMNGENLRYIFTGNDAPKFPNHMENKLVLTIYTIETGPKALTSRLRNNVYVKCIKRPKGGMYQYPVFEVSMCFVETILNNLNRELINKRIDILEERRSKQKDEKITKEQSRLFIIDQKKSS